MTRGVDSSPDSIWSDVLRLALVAIAAWIYYEVVGWL